MENIDFRLLEIREKGSCLIAGMCLFEFNKCSIDILHFSVINMCTFEHIFDNLLNFLW